MNEPPDTERHYTYIQVHIASLL